MIERTGHSGIARTSARKQEDYYFGETNDIRFYLIYKPSLDFLESTASALDGARGEQIAKACKERGKKAYVYAAQKLVSPITMSTKRERDGKPVMHYCLPDDPAFSELIRQNLIRKHEAIHGHAPHEDTLTFTFDDGYIRKRQGRVTRLVDYKGIKIKGIMCPFRVSGSPALIQVGYECGFGDKNSAGFGMAEV